MLSDDPTDEAFGDEYFSPIPGGARLPDDKYDEILDAMDHGSKYALTGSVIADDRPRCWKTSNAGAVRRATSTSTTKPTGPWSGQQPPSAGRGLGHQRQRPVRAEPAALEFGAVDQETFVPADRTISTRTWGLTAWVFQRVARPAILAASRPPASGGRQALPLTRAVVLRFVPGEAVADALGRWPVCTHFAPRQTIDHLDR